jgi:hypothetical protein
MNCPVALARNGIFAFWRQNGDQLGMNELNACDCNNAIWGSMGRKHVSPLEMGTSEGEGDPGIVGIAVIAVIGTPKPSSTPLGMIGMVWGSELCPKPSNLTTDTADNIDYTDQKASFE